jgi:transposase
MNTVEEKLEKIEAMLADLLAERQTVREWYTTTQVAQLLGKAEFTVREWCRRGRVNAAKKTSGRGAHASWTISRNEFLRIQREGLLPCP